VPGKGDAVLSLRQGATGDLQLRYKDESGKQRIGFTDGLGGWLMWSEWASNNAYIAGNLGLGVAPGSAYRLAVQGAARINGVVTVDGLIVNGWQWRMGGANDWVGNSMRWNGGRSGYSIWDQLSDGRLKTDLDPIADALAKVRALRGVTYHWNERALGLFSAEMDKSLSSGLIPTTDENRELQRKEREKLKVQLTHAHVGLVAQDVEKVLPEAVAADDDGYKTVRYQNLIPLLTEAVKELDRTLAEQARRIAQQQSEIERLAASHDALQRQLTNLSAADVRAGRR
jgi:hypothetical protein